MNIFVLFLSEGSCYDPLAAFFRHGVSPGGKKWGEVIGVSPPLSFSIQILRDCVRILPILLPSFSYVLIFFGTGHRHTQLHPNPVIHFSPMKCRSARASPR